eukprot:3927246-Heterocapsa_arctica.AAC.1
MVARFGTLPGSSTAKRLGCALRSASEELNNQRHVCALRYATRSSTVKRHGCALQSASRNSKG